MNIFATIRAGNRVKRYHTQEILKEERVGQHCANVCAILIDLYHPHLPPADLLVYALRHDVAEQYTGDMPANVKKERPALKVAMEEVEMDWELEHWPRSRPTDVDMAVFKFADAMDCALKCCEELLMGNRMVTHMAFRAMEYMGRAQGEISAFHPACRRALQLRKIVNQEMENACK